VDAALASLTDTDATAGADAIMLNASDSFGNTATQQTIGVTVASGLGIAVPGAQVVGVGKAAAITTVSLSDGSTVANETFTATLSDGTGLLSVTSSGGATLTGNGSKAVTVTGSFTAVNATLATLMDTDATAGTDTITVNATDSQSETATQHTIGVTVDGTPVLHVPGAQTLSSGVATGISGVSLTESGSTGSPETFTATLSDTNGTLSVTANGATLTGNGTKSVTVSGTLTQVDAALASLTDTDATTGADTITVNASDSFGNAAAQQTIGVSVASSSSPISWNAAVSGNWNTGSNWSSGTVPGAANQADISVAGTYAVMSTQNNTVGSLDISDTSAILSIINSTFTLNDQAGTVNSGTILVDSGSALDLNAGTLTNAGVIALASSPSTSVLGISGNVALNGGGDVLLANQQSSIVGLGSGATLTNVNDTIVGAGTVGNSQLSLVNGGTIEAHIGTLTVTTGTNSVSNLGALGSIGGDLVVDNSVVGTGTEQISQGGTMEFAGAVSSGQTLTFSGAGDTLKLDSAQSFTATLVGLAAASNSSFDSVDLANFKFADTTITSVTGTGAAGTTTNVTLTDSADNLTTTLHLLNQYANQFAVNASDYSLTSDLGAGTPGTNFSVDYVLGTPNHGVGH
jgi:hypothetical protein